MNQNLRHDDAEEYAPLPSFSSVQESDVGRASLSANLWDNPMLAEVRRVGKRFVTYDRKAGTRAALSWILAGAYLTFLLFSTIDGVRHGVHFLTLIMPKFIILVPMSVLMGYNLISGEREKRSWDLLRTAPLSASQLVLGKLAGLATTITAFSVLLSVPALLSGRLQDTRGGFLPMAEWLSAEFTVWVVLMFVCSLTVAVSARSRRSLVSLSTTVALLLGGYAGVPTLCGLFFPDVLPFLMYILPITGVVDFPPPGEALTGSPLWGALFHLCLITVALVFALVSVRAVDRKDMQ